MDLKAFVLSNPIAGMPVLFTHERCGNQYAFVDGQSLDDVHVVLAEHPCVSDETVNRREQFRLTNSSIEHLVDKSGCGRVLAVGTRTPLKERLRLQDEHQCGKETWDGKPLPEEVAVSGDFQMGVSKTL